jgi:hypothetical protein
MPASTRSQQPRILDEVHQVLCLHHYSMHAERSPGEWFVRFVPVPPRAVARNSTEGQACGCNRAEGKVSEGHVRKGL